MDFDSQEDFDAQIAQGEALAQLILKRNDLLRSLQQANTEIAVMMTAVGVKPTGSVKENSSGSINPEPSEVQSKPKIRSKTTLIGHILGALSSSVDGLTKSEITQKIFDAGYQTNSDYPDRMINQALYSLQSKKAILVGQDHRYKLLKTGD